MNTDFLNLILTDETETAMTFLEWRTLINGTSGSNMQLIDIAIKEINDAIESLDAKADGKADGFNYNPATGVLQLLSKGENIEGASVTINLNNYYSKEEIDEIIDSLADSDTINEIKNSAVGRMIWDENTRKLNAVNLNNEIIGEGIEISGGGEGGGSDYDVTYDSETGAFNLLENDEIKTSLTIIGGSGGGEIPTSNLTVKKITPSPLTLTPTDAVNITINYSSIDSDDSPVDGTYVWTMGSKVIESGTLNQGLNTFDLTKFVSIGTQTLVLAVTDAYGNKNTKSWTVKIVDVRLSSSFNDKAFYDIGQPVYFQYTPYGSISKEVHFILDGVELATETITTSGIVQSYIIPAQTHGAHLLECYITANVGGMTIETEHIYKDIIWYDESVQTPVIGCAYRNDYHGMVTVKQYDTLLIEYNVFDPSTSSPQVTLSVDGNIVSTNKLTSSRNVWSYKADTIGNHTLVISCIGEETSSVIIKVAVEELGIDVGQITGGLVVDFNPVGLTNQSEGREWSNGKYSFSVSDNFDWANGGYKRDENGDTYFLVKSGTRATLNYYMFSGSANSNVTSSGTEIKLVFKTENVQDANAVWFSNVESSTNEISGVAQTTNMGIQMGVHEGWLKTNNASDSENDGIAATNTYLYLPYSEEDIIEMDINIDSLNKEDSSAQSFAMAYEDGVPCKAYVYSGGDRFYQYNPKPIVIGSDFCDVRIYRLKIYSFSLSTESIMKNFIADARNSTTMMERYSRNSIYYNNETNEYTPYSSQGTLDPERVAKAIPNVKVLMLETDHFTTSKKDFVKANLRCIHASGGDLYSGDSYYDNWYFENGWHSGQGTTSDNYGVSGRNVDFLFNCDGEHKPSDKIKNPEPNYISRVTLGYGTEKVSEPEYVTDWKGNTGKVTLTRTSVPNNFFNLKVNIASSENANNALLQKRYDDFLPYITPAKKRNSNVKNDMEFVPAILFIKETNPDISSHNEFLDTNWHFYALGNIGDSKKTDYTRAYDPDDMNEFVIEISDNTKNNATFQSGVYLDKNNVQQIETFTITESEEDGETVLIPVSDNKPQSFVYPITLEQWNNPNNMRSWCINNEGFDGDHSFEPRYACCGDYRDGKLVNDTTGRGAEQILLNNDVWRAFYRWVVTSTDEQFRDELDQWCVRSAVEFFYAFTHIYTMMDNRAKNTFWHFAKTGTYREVSRPVPELLHIYCELIDGEYVTTTDTVIDDDKTYYTEYAFDLWDYDNDTALGINNNGELIFPYGKEDSDYNIDGDSSSGYVFNGALSTFWCRLRDLMSNEINSTFQGVVSECFSANNLINEFDKYQECYPEEIWRLDIQRKYLRTFTGESIDNSKQKKDIVYLRDMMQGRKKYQRRQWIRDQEIYFGTKHLFGNSISDNNKVVFRCYNPGTNVPVAPDYTLKITPYTDMYVAAMFGNGDTRKLRCKAGEVCNITFNVSDASDTQVTVYGASRIQAFDDLSACYLSTGTFASATKLKKLILGNSTPGYQNTRLANLSLASNAGTILEELNVKGCVALAGELNLINYSNLKKLYAEGTKIRTAIFPTNGRLEVAHLPSTITTLTMRNLNYLKDFDEVAFDNIEVLTLEGDTFDIDNILENSIDTLRSLSLYGVDWTIKRANILKDIYSLPYSYISGTIKVTEDIGSYEVACYKNKWTDITFDLSEATLIPYYTVRFLDDNGDLLDTQFVTRGNTSIDPISRSDNPIRAPFKEATNQYIYTFNGWDKNVENTLINGDTDFIATYTTEVRTYTARWYNGDTLLSAATAAYGEELVYDGDDPTDTSLEAYSVYKLFSGWDKSTGCITGDVNVYAKFIEAAVPTDKELSEMTPAELNALVKAGILSSSSTNNTIISSGDEIDLIMSNDYDFDNVASHEIVEVGDTKIFDGTNYINTGYKLFDEDKSFVLAIDYKFTDVSIQSHLAGCFDINGVTLSSDGNNAVVRLGSNTPIQVAKSTDREMVVIRKKKGDNNLYVYASNCYGDNMIVSTISNSFNVHHNAPLVLGATIYEDGEADNFAKGEVYWAKLWEDDLGDVICRKIGSWTRELITMRASGSEEHNFRLFKRSDNGRYANCFFLMKNLLDRTHAIKISGGTVGGWNSSDMRTWLNERIYNGIPNQWKRLIKQVDVNSSAGNLSYNIITSQDYVFIPSYKEIGAYTTTNPYVNESDAIINYFTNAESKIKKLANGTGAACNYWLRSPSVRDAKANGQITGVGNDNAANTNVSYGVCFGFCI